MKKVKTSVNLSRRAHKNARKVAKREKRSVSSLVELWLENTFGGNGRGEVSVVPATPEVPGQP